MKPVCVPCQRFYRCKRNGFEFIEAMPKEGNPMPGTSAPESWEPYKLWAGDLWTCEGCGSEIVVGVGRVPIAEHFHTGFGDRAARAALRVNDC